MEHIAHDETSFVRPAEVGEMELYHPKTWLGKYVFSQDAKTIAIQYAGRSEEHTSDSSHSSVSRMPSSA